MTVAGRSWRMTLAKAYRLCCLIGAGQRVAGVQRMSLLERGLVERVLVRLDSGRKAWDWRLTADGRRLVEVVDACLDYCPEPIRTRLTA